MVGRFSVFLYFTSTKKRIKCLPQGHITATPVSLELAALRSLPYTEKTEPLRSACSVSSRSRSAQHRRRYIVVPIEQRENDALIDMSQCTAM